MEKIQLDLLEKGQLLPVMEEFYSLQGEGYNTGKAACFIRIGGCDVGCYWCDVKESWNPSLHPLKDVDEVVANVAKFPAKAVVITGGEPLTYNLDYLCAKFRQEAIHTFVETSGSQPLSGDWDWICLSPKKQNPPLDVFYRVADELKVIIHDISDFKWAEENLDKVDYKCRLYLQPEWSKIGIMMPEIVDYVLQNPRWMVSLQSHKYMNIP